MVNEPVPLMIPENTVLVLSAPAVSIPLPSVTFPEPASEPIVSLLLFRSNVAPPATVTAVESDRTSLAPSCSVPALTIVGPV